MNIVSNSIAFVSIAISIWFMSFFFTLQAIKDQLKEIKEELKTMNRKEKDDWKYD